MPANSSQPSAREPLKRSTIWILAFVTALLTINWLAAVARFQVNVPIWDQWDFFGPLFDGKGWWDLFNFQHGPPRLGPGLVIDSWVMAISNWDTRIESLWIVSLLILSSLLALNLKKQLSGRLSALDASIPLIILSLSQWGSVIAVPIASHSVFALLLLLGACNVWLLRSPSLRFPITGILSVALTFSGFGLFAGGMLAILLAIHFVQSCLPFEKRAALPAAAGLILASAGWLAFAHGYQFNPASDGYHFPHKPLFDYARFLALMFAHPLGWDSGSGPAYTTGAILLLSCIGISGTAVYAWFRQRDGRRRLLEIIAVLTGSGLAFAAFAAVGRIHLGVTAGMASRYTTLLIPLWFGLLFWGTAQARPALRHSAIILTWFIALLPFTPLLHRPASDWPGTAGLTEPARLLLADSTHEKIAWVSTYLHSGDSREADRAAGRLIHPAGESIGLERKLAWLKTRRFSFFKSASSTDAWQPWWPENRSTWLRTHDPEGDKCWMADDCSLWLSAEQDGFVNFQVVQTARGLPANAQLKITHRQITASESAEFLHEIISLPITKGEQQLTLRSMAGTVPAHPLNDNRLISHRLTNPWITRRPDGIEWILSSSAQGQSTWVPRYRWRILSGFHGWEHPAPFGWSDASLKIEIHSKAPVFLNVHIDKRYHRVASGPVIILLPDRRIEIPDPDDQAAFSIPIPASSAPTIIQIENPAGAASPHISEGKSDTRLLALKLGHLSVSQAPRFHLLNDIR